MSRSPNKTTGKKQEETLYFKVSAGLKRVIGRDLITDDEVAIFELVKNSWDAGAKSVQLYFEDDRIAVIDDGHGMSQEDIIEKWLLVAYSSKRGPSDEEDEGSSYRDHIGANRHLAGSKGIGRFSSDRLGRELRLQSCPKTRNAPVHVVDIDWDRFEVNEKRNFVDVELDYSESDKFELPKGVRAPRRGTALEVSGLRTIWDRGKLLKLKASLAKLINPFGADVDKFSLQIIAPGEVGGDDEVSEDYNNWDEADREEWGFPYYDVVNGSVENFIFETLKEKTTYLEVFLTQDDKFIETSLVDRGEEVYRIEEPNPYSHLIGSEFNCNLFYLNRSAKNTFSRRMGVAPVNFGSVFLFRNQIRVYPFGERGDDILGIDARKQQGQARFLGSRDIIGRISVAGDEEHFKEVTSRNAGLVDTPAYNELVDCFWEKCLKRLEKYVVGVSWPDPGEKSATDLSRLLTNSGRSRVTDVVASLARTKDVTLLAFSDNLVQILDEKADEFEGSLQSIKSVAEKAGDNALLDRVAKAEKRFRELQRAEAEAYAKAESERKAREKAEVTLRKTEYTLEKTEVALEEERKRALFLSSLSTVGEETLQNLHHQIGIYASDVQNIITGKLEDIRWNDAVDKEDIVSTLGVLLREVQKIISATRFATKANFRMDAETCNEDLVEFISQYVVDILPLYNEGRIEIVTNTDGGKFVTDFKPIEVSIILDNLINNARKAGATQMVLDMRTVERGKELRIQVSDNGDGLDPSILEPDRIFEKGVSTTDGSGLGLYNVRQMLDEMGGSISFDDDLDDGFSLAMRVMK